MLQCDGHAGKNNATVVINATNLGAFLDGIGVYTLTLLRQLAGKQTHLSFIIYLNRSCEPHLKEIHIPANWTMRWVTARLSPDHGFKGHFLRLLFAQWIGLRHPGSLVFGTSQLEAILFRRNQVLTIHDVIPLLFKRCHAKQYYYYKYFLRSVLRRARSIVTPSEHTLRCLVQHFGLDRARVQMIHNGIEADTPCEPAGRPQGGGKFILFTGRIVRMKNVTGVLKAFARIKDRVPHTLVIAGHARKDVTLEFQRARLARYHLEDDRVVFRGHVSSAEMRSLLREADALVFPSFYEGFGLPPVEAMAAGCPAVVSRVSSLPEVCGDAAFYVDPYNVTDIAEGMYRVVTDEVLRRGLIERGYDRARRFSAEAFARKHLLVLEGLVNGTVPDRSPATEIARPVRRPVPAALRTRFRMNEHSRP